MVKKIDINCDMGESFGNWIHGNDREVMKFITSANVACGFHAGDPTVMMRTVEWAKQHNVAVGSHTGLPDLMGFGRREMKITPEEARCYTLYQTGALKGFLDAAKMKLQHVKPHGAMYTILKKSEEMSAAICDAILEIDPNLYWFMPVPNLSATVARDHGVKVVGELYVDMDYASDGSLMVRRDQHLHESNPKETAAKIIRFLDEGKVRAVDGKDLEIEAQSVCVHGDSRNAVQTLETIRAELKKANVEVVPVSKIM
ncbi:MAG: LamB/YcsF family protein [Candidatus Bathyarchaeia archaeon]